MNTEAYQALSKEERKEFNRNYYQRRKAKNGPAFIEKMTDNYRLRNYGVSKEQFNMMLERQQNRCPITHERLNRSSCVDHSHETGKVRGVLSHKANAAIGFLKENPEAFYRAVAYLTLDRTKKLIYVIGSLRNSIIPDVGIKLRGAGFDAFDNWISAGERADDSWQEYSKRRGLTYTEALASREANHVFRFDKAYLDLCDAAVLVMPAGKSGFLELGYVTGLGKPTYILLDEETEKNRYDVMPQFATMISNNLDHIIEDLKEQENEQSWVIE